MEQITWRQKRLVEWMRAPVHSSLPQDDTIDWTAALWKVSDLVKLAGVTTIYTDAQCRADIKALVALDLVSVFKPADGSAIRFSIRRLP